MSLVNCSPEKWWGSHLIIDCASGNDNVSSIIAVRVFIDDLVKTIDMEKHGPIQIDRFGEGDLKGISCCQFIKTSSIVGHFCDVNRNFYLDIFSCKRFSTSKVLECVRKHFNPDIVKHSLVERGI